MESRRRFLALSGALIASAVLQPARSLAAHVGQTKENLPNPSLFRAGDLLWPRGSTAIVPYAKYSTDAKDEDIKEWVKGRDAFVASITSKGAKASSNELKARSRLQSMSYSEFEGRYLKAPTDDPIMPYGSLISTGHVALITEESVDPIIVEAVWGNVKKVRTIRYSEWLHDRPDELVWHGRLTNLPSVERARVAGAALRYVDRPYDFWNFNLADASGFYCSKLVWLSIRDALGFAVDDNTNPDRSFWYSPRQLLNSQFIFRLNNPAPYGG